MPNLPFRPLASYLIRRTVLLAAVCLFGVLAFHSLVRFQQQQERFAQVIDDIAQTSVPLLSVSLWDIEPAALQLQLDMLARRPEIGYVRLVAGTGQRFWAGDAQLAEAPVTRQLVVPKPQGQGDIGQLEIVGDAQFLYREIVKDVLAVLASHGAFTVLVCVLIAVMLRKDLQQPLERIGRFAAELRPQQLMTPLALERPQRPQIDEIDLLADGFRKLQAGLQHHIANLDRTVAERTGQLEAAMEELRRLTRTDALTGCFNRRELESRLPAEAERAQRYGRPLSVVFCDIDHFKRCERPPWPCRRRCGAGCGGDALPWRNAVQRRLGGALRWRRVRGGAARDRSGGGGGHCRTPAPDHQGDGSAVRQRADPPHRELRRGTAPAGRGQSGFSQARG